MIHTLWEQQIIKVNRRLRDHCLIFSSRISDSVIILIWRLENIHKREIQLIITLWVIEVSHVLIKEFINNKMTVIKIDKSIFLLGICWSNLGMRLEMNLMCIMLTRYMIYQILIELILHNLLRKFIKLFNSLVVNNK